MKFSIVLRTLSCSVFYLLCLLSTFSGIQTLDFLLILDNSCFRAPVCSWHSHWQPPAPEWFAEAKGGVCCWDLHSDLSVEVGEVQVKLLRGELFSVCGDSRSLVASCTRDLGRVWLRLWNPQILPGSGKPIAEAKPLEWWLYIFQHVLLTLSIWCTLAPYNHCLDNVTVLTL